MTMLALTIDPHGRVPIYQQISSQLSEAVAEGRLRPGDALWSARRIAAHYQISYQTAERALAQLAKAGIVSRSVGGGTVVALHPASGGPPRRAKTRLIAMLNCWQVFDGEHPLYTLSELREIQAAAQVLTLRMWGMLFASFPTEQFTVSHLADWARQHRFDGVLVFGELPPPALRWLERQGYGVVIVDADPEQVSCARVVQDNSGGIQQVMQHLAERGHRRVAYLGGRTSYHYGARQAAYETACRAMGMDSDPALIVTTRRPHPTVEEAVRRILEAGPTALVVGSDILAAFVVRALQEFGKTIPNDISVVGFDDEPFCQTLTPPLTTVRIPFEELGRLGARLLLDQLEDVEDLPTRTVVPAQLVVRDSVATLSRDRS